MNEPNRFERANEQKGVTVCTRCKRGHDEPSWYGLHLCWLCRLIASVPRG